MARRFPTRYPLAAGALALGSITLTAGAQQTESATEAEFNLAPITVWGEQEDRPSAGFNQAYDRTQPDITIDGQDARAFNSANNYDALRLVPGLNYLQGAGRRSSKPSRIRGANNWTVSSKIAGYPTISVAGNGAEDGGMEADFNSIIPSIALDQLRVERGGLGVRYGEGANGGVIVSELKRGHAGGPRGGIWLEHNAISEELYMADVGGGTANGQFDYYVAGKVFNGDYKEVTDQDGQQLQDDELVSGLARFGWQPIAGGRLDVTSLAGKDTINAVLDSGEGDERHTENTTRFVGVRYEQLFSENLGADLGYSYWFTEAVRVNATTDEAERIRPQSARTWFANGYLETELAENLSYHLATGIETVDHRQREEANDSDKNQHFRDSGIYLANTLGVGEALSFNTGARYARSESDFREDDLWLYDAGAAYTFVATGTRLRTSWSTDYYRNKGFVFFFGPIEQAGGLIPAETETLELGIDQAWGRYGRTSLTLFRTDTENDPTFAGWGAGEVYYRETRAEGVELYNDFWLRPDLQLVASGSWIETEVTGFNPAGGATGGTSIPAPRWSAALGLNWHLTPALRLQTLASYDDGMRSESIDEDTGEVTTTTHAGYTRWNVAGFWDITPAARVFVRVENLLDEEDLGFTQEVRGPEGNSETELVGEDPGRFASLGFYYQW